MNKLITLTSICTLIYFHFHMPRSSNSIIITIYSIIYCTNPPLKYNVSFILSKRAYKTSLKLYVLLLMRLSFKLSNEVFIPVVRCNILLRQQTRFAVYYH